MICVTGWMGALAWLAASVPANPGDSGAVRDSFSSSVLVSAATTADSEAASKADFSSLPIIPATAASSVGRTLATPRITSIAWQAPKEDSEASPSDEVKPKPEAPPMPPAKPIAAAPMVIGPAPCAPVIICTPAPTCCQPCVVRCCPPRFRPFRGACR